MSLIIGYIVIIFILKGKESVKTGWENIVFGKGKLKTDFQRFLPTWEQRKKQGTYFKIGQTYFKISQTYFFGPENPFQKCLKNADKNRRPFARGGRGDYSSRKLKLISSPENIMRVSCARVIAVKLPACALLRVHCPWLTV